MSRPQRWVLVLGLLLIGAMALFPPWLYVHNRSVQSGRTIPGSYSVTGAVAQRSERPAGYHFLAGTHVPQDQTALAHLFSLPLEQTELSNFAIRIDTQRLAIQMLATAVLTCVLVLVVRGRVGD